MTIERPCSDFDRLMREDFRIEDAGRALAVEHSEHVVGHKDLLAFHCDLRFSTSEMPMFQVTTSAAAAMSP
jgi:hypothetical protein